MSQSHQLQLQRFELKYVVPESTALKVRDFVRSYLIIDEYGDGQPDFSYPVHSLYLDSDLLTIYWGTINGNKNRFKLRLRFYEDAPRAPVFFDPDHVMLTMILASTWTFFPFVVIGVLVGFGLATGGEAGWAGVERARDATGMLLLLGLGTTAGVATTALFLGLAASWWIATLWSLPLVLIGALLIVRKIRRFDLWLAFITVFLTGIVITSLIAGKDVASTLLHALIYAPVLFLGGIMLTKFFNQLSLHLK